MSDTHPPIGHTRRDWLKAVPAAAALPLNQAAAQTPATPNRPNILLIISDQFRWDCVGATGLNPLGLTPHLDRMAARGVMFRSAFCNQPVCAPARGSIFTSQYPSRHGVWKNGIGLPENANTLAKSLRGAGYTANYIGKWHLAPPGTGDAASGTAEPRGPVAPQHRGGFLDLWEGANALEWTSHAYEGNLFDNDGKPIHFSGQYRTDFMTARATGLIKGLVVHARRMRANLDRSGGLYFSEAVLLALVKTGLPRQEAYVLVQKAALAAVSEAASVGTVGALPGRFRELLGQDSEVTSRLDTKTLDACFDLDHHLRHVPVILERALGASK